MEVGSVNVGKRHGVQRLELIVSKVHLIRYNSAVHPTVGTRHG